MKILVLATRDESGKLIVSYGVRTDTLESVVLPNEPFEKFMTQHCVRDLEHGNYYLKE
jgi:hypothetical protein